MKKYVTFVKDEEESRQVQEALFRAGFEWGSSDGYRAGRTPFIQINFYGSSGTIDYTDCFKWAVEHARDEGHIPINADSIIDNPFQLDGATQPNESGVIGLTLEDRVSNIENMFKKVCDMLQVQDEFK